MPALKKGLSGLEPYEGKLSRTVLRGGSGGNITLLPGAQALNSRVNPNTSAPKMVPGRYDPVYEEGSQDYPRMACDACGSGWFSSHRLPKYKSPLKRGRKSGTVVADLP